MKKYWIAGLVLTLTCQLSARSLEMIEATGNKVSLRAAPKLNAVLMDQAMKGDQFILVDESTPGWYGVIPPESADVWVSCEFIKDNMVSPQRLNVRSGPSLNYEVVGVLYGGDRVSVRGIKSGWFKIAATERTTVWISRKYSKTTSKKKRIKLDVPEEIAEEKVVSTKLDIPSKPLTDITVEQKPLTDLSVINKPKETTDLSVINKPKKTTDLSVIKQPKKTTDLSVINKPKKTTDLSVINKPKKTTDLSVINKPKKTTDLSAIKKPKKTTDLSAIKKPKKMTDITVKQRPLTDLSVIDKPKKTTNLSVINKKKAPDGAFKYVSEKKQGVLKHYTGTLKSGGSGLFKLVDTKSSNLTICFVRGNKEQLDDLINKPLAITGETYWFVGMADPIVIPHKIQFLNK